MAVAVQGHAMPGRDDLRREAGISLDLLADQEERRRHTGVGQRGEHRGRALGVRAVVERERIAPAARGAVLDA